MLVFDRVRSSTLLDDHRAGEAGAAVLARQRAGDDNRIRRDPAVADLAGGAVDDLGRSAEEHAHRQHRALLDDHAFGDFGARADEAIVLDDHRPGLKRLEHAADPGAARNVDVPADLGAAADGRPGVDHRAFADARADVDEARHQHRAGRDVGAAADDRAGNRAEAGVGELLLAPAGELGRHLVPPVRAARAAGDRLHRVEPEGQQHRLLEPLVDDPLAADLFGDPRVAAVEHGDRGIDRLADLAFGRAPIASRSSQARSTIAFS